MLELLDMGLMGAIIFVAIVLEALPILVGVAAMVLVVWLVRRARMEYLALPLLVLLLHGCAQTNLGKTTLSYTNGKQQLAWDNSKDIDVEYDPETGKFSLKSMTPEAAMAASAMAQIKMLELMQQILPLLKQAAPVPVPQGMVRSLPCGLNVNECRREWYVPEKVPLLE